jgi:hypothetical protein
MQYIIFRQFAKSTQITFEAVAKRKLLLDGIQYVVKTEWKFVCGIYLLHAMSIMFCNATGKLKLKYKNNIKL